MIYEREHHSWEQPGDQYLLSELGIEIGWRSETYAGEVAREDLVEIIKEVWDKRDYLGQPLKDALVARGYKLRSRP